MLHKVSSSYREIAKHIPELAGLISTPAYNKQLLLKMAEKGEPRPYHKSLLGTALNRYANKGLSCYDPAFAKKIRKVAPHWFISKSEVAKQKKNSLLEMAGKNEKRPSRNRPLGQPLCDYTNPASSSFDSDFTKKIKRIAPQWFVCNFDVCKQRKKELLKMAQKGSQKPPRAAARGVPAPARPA